MALLSSVILTLISSVVAYAYVDLDYSHAEMDDDVLLLPRLPEGLSDIEPQKVNGTSEQIEPLAVVEGEPSPANFPEGFDDYELYAEFQVYVLVAGDEEWQDVSYWTPFGCNKDWKHAAYEIIERCDTHSFWPKHHLNLHIIGYVTWDSRDHVTGISGMLTEMLEDVGWQANMKYNGQTAHILIGFTGQRPDYDQGVARRSEQACLYYPDFWPFNENGVLHEVSHLLKARDHRNATDPNFDSDCVMSYKMEYVGFYWECGYVWYLGMNIQRAFLTYNWCDTCFNTVHSHRGDYAIIRIPNGEPGGFPPGIKDEEEV